MASLRYDGLTETLFTDTNHIVLFPSGVLVKTLLTQSIEKNKEMYKISEVAKLLAQGRVS